MTKVFVYGRLTTGGHYHQHYLQGQKFLGKGFINGYKKYVLGGLHGIFPVYGERVQGEAYEVDPKTLAKLDFFHNIGTHFTRRIIDVELETGETLQADAYIWNR